MTTKGQTCEDLDAERLLEALNDPAVLAALGIDSDGNDVPSVLDAPLQPEPDPSRVTWPPPPRKPISLMWQFVIVVVTFIGALLAMLSAN